MSGFKQFGFGRNDQSIGKKNKRFKLDTGENARISFAWWPGLDDGMPIMEGSPNFAGAPRHYLKGVGYFINKGPEYTKLAGEPPKTRIATLIIKWPLNGSGGLDMKAISEGNYQVLPFVFDEGKYDAIKPIHTEWPLSEHDLTVNCSDAGFQKMTFSPCKENVLRKLLSKGAESQMVKDLILTCQQVSANVESEIGRDMTLDEIREKLSGASGGGFSSPTGKVNLPQTALANEEIDSALDDLLD